MLSPIPKPGKNPNNLEGYRPISLLPVLSKFFENIIARRLINGTKNFISDRQHAFLPRHGVHSLCHSPDETIRNNLKSRKHSFVLSEDIEKAFGKVVYTLIIIEMNKSKNNG